MDSVGVAEMISDVPVVPSLALNGRLRRRSDVGESIAIFEIQNAEFIVESASSFDSFLPAVWGCRFWWTFGRSVRKKG
jgi:hypothetical protein